MESPKKFLSLVKKGESSKVISELENCNLSEHLDTFGAALLRYSSKHGNVEVTKYLLNKGCDVNAQDSNGKTALMRAIKGEHDSVVKVLLAAGANISSVFDHEKQSALHIICAEHNLRSEFRLEVLKHFRKECSSSEEAATKLIEAGSHVYQAVYTKDAKVVELLLESGLSVDSMIPSARFTALHIAVLLEDMETVRVLLKFGADAEAFDAMGRSPLYYVYYMSEQEEHSIDKVEIVRLLVNHSSSPVSVSQVGSILTTGNAAVLRALLPALNFSDDDHILHYLALNSEPGVIDELKLYIDRCNVNNLNSAGLSALQLAAINGNVQMLEFLLEHGAAVNQADRRQGFTALFYAYERSSRKRRDEYDECVELLLEHRADPQFVTKNAVTIFDVVRGNKRLEPVIAQLAVMEESGTLVTEEIREKISSKRRLSKYYNTCRRVLREGIEGSVTLLKLITGSEKVLENYAGNEELELKLKRMARRYTLRFNLSYYCNVLSKRFSKADQRRRLSDTGAEVLGELFKDFCVDNKHIVVGKMTDYLTDEDLRQLLCQLEI